MLAIVTVVGDGRDARMAPKSARLAVFSQLLKALRDKKHRKYRCISICFAPGSIYKVFCPW